MSLDYYSKNRRIRVIRMECNYCTVVPRMFAVQRHQSPLGICLTDAVVLGTRLDGDHPASVSSQVFDWDQQMVLALPYLPVLSRYCVLHLPLVKEHPQPFGGTLHLHWLRLRLEDHLRGVPPHCLRLGVFVPRV